MLKGKNDGAFVFFCFAWHRGGISFRSLFTGTYNHGSFVQPVAPVEPDPAKRTYNMPTLNIFPVNESCIVKRSFRGVDALLNDVCVPIFLPPLTLGSASTCKRGGISFAGEPMQWRRPMRL
jgi:hypothetical protein